MTLTPKPGRHRLRHRAAAACLPVALTWHAACAQPIPLMPPTTAGRAVVATPLPAPPLPPGSPSLAYLEAARSALARGRLGETQEALERAETRLLDRAVNPAAVDRPDTQRVVLDIGVARQALAARDRYAASRAIGDAMAALETPPPVAQAVETPPIGQPALVPGPPPGPPPVTKALLPGHWQLDGANWVWVPPETRLRRVEERPLVLGAYVWREGAWRWVPPHYASD